jgi:hypothetical protein
VARILASRSATGQHCGGIDDVEPLLTAARRELLLRRRGVASLLARGGACVPEVCERLVAGRARQLRGLHS